MHNLTNYEINYDAIENVLSEWTDEDLFLPPHLSMLLASHPKIHYKFVTADSNSTNIAEATFNQISRKIFIKE